MNIKHILLFWTNKFGSVRFKDNQVRRLPEGRAYFIPNVNSMRIKTVQVRVCSAFDTVKVIFTSDTIKMISGRRNRCFKICRSETIFYLKKLNKPMKPSSVRMTFPPKFLINLIGAGSFPGTSYCQRSLVLNPFN